MSQSFTSRTKNGFFKTFAVLRWRFREERNRFRNATTYDRPSLQSRFSEPKRCRGKCFPSRKADPSEFPRSAMPIGVVFSPVVSYLRGFRMNAGVGCDFFVGRALRHFRAFVGSRLVRVTYYVGVTFRVNAVNSSKTEKTKLFKKNQQQRKRIINR